VGDTFRHKQEVISMKKSTVNKNNNPWDFLDQYRGKTFKGEWPTIDKLFEITAHRYPERRCFTSFDGEEISLTYGDAYGIVTGISKYLSQRGIKRGDKIALTGKNSPEWTLAFLSILSAGGVVVPIDYQLETEKILHLARFAGSRCLFIDEEKYDYAKQSGDFSLIISLSDKRPGYILDIAGKGETTRPEPDKPEKNEVTAETGQFDDSLQKPSPGMQPEEDDLAAILFTSGTTGNEKGVMLTHGNLVSDVFLAQSLLNVSKNDVFYALLPLHHSYSMNAVFLQAISVGAEIVFAKRLVVKEILSDLKRGRVTMFLGIPLLFNKLLKGILKGIREKGIVVYAIVRLLMGFSGLVKKVLKVNPGKRLFHSILSKASLDSIRICISGGGPLAPSTFKMYNQFGIDFVQGYGLTETSPIVTLNPVERYKVTSVGKVIPRVDVRIKDEDEKGIGEILIKGPIVTGGYYKNPEATREAFTEDGYLKTGDLGYLDSENYLYLAGRKKSMIVTEGGKNVYPEEIEDHFQLYEEIEQIVVRGFTKDEQMKVEGIEALVYPSPDYFEEYGEKGKRERIGRIISEVNRELLPYQRIERFTLLDEPMEMTTTKKIKRYKLKST